MGGGNACGIKMKVGIEYKSDIEAGKLLIMRDRVLKQTIIIKYC